MRVKGKLGFVKKKMAKSTHCKSKKVGKLNKVIHVQTSVLRRQNSSRRIRRREIRSLYRGQYFAEFPNSASVDNTNFVLDNSSYYHAQPHSIIVNYPI
jgi:hypothetical protein